MVARASQCNRFSPCRVPAGEGLWSRRRHPLVRHPVSVNLIADTATRTGRTIRSGIDPNRYPMGIKVSDGRMEDLAMRRGAFHGERNALLVARPQRSFHYGEDFEPRFID